MDLNSNTTISFYPVKAMYGRKEKRRDVLFLENQKTLILFLILKITSQMTLRNLLKLSGSLFSHLQIKEVEREDLQNSHQLLYVMFE